MPRLLDTRILEEINRAARVVEEGGIILYPTDTIWGIGCDATNEEAIKRIYRLKNRPEAKSLTALVATQDQLLRHVKDIPSLAFDLMDCATRPMTIVYDCVKGVSPVALADDGSMGVRVVGDDFCKALINKIKRPLISTSANISSHPSPACYDDIESEIINGVDYVVDYRRGERTSDISSTIIKLTNDCRITVIRK
ncbi:MAG: threonylcarbamoyl-AMP synthase [Flavobacteriales bacterium]|nr:threonylcarbamoyl-AMP synthase [Flavobacteriales bacterium]